VIKTLHLFDFLVSDSPEQLMGYSGESSQHDCAELDSLSTPGSGRAIYTRRASEAHIC
jgi:hypothetical protein